MKNTNHFDYIIIGAGAAGLMLANAMAKDDFFSQKTILLLDRDAKKTNDRTWCFWEKGEGPFDTIVHKTWNHIFFRDEAISKRFKISPYIYKMIRGIDFYNTYLQTINRSPNLFFRQETVVQVTDEVNSVSVATAQSRYSAKQVFNSIFDYKMVVHQKKYPVLQQHFLGWFIKTETPVFDVDQATYMDFSIPQEGNTRFMYVLPFSETEALVEYTLFSEKLLAKTDYEQGIENYLKNVLGCHNYKITDEEQGSIPMTSYDFAEHHRPNMRYIGTAGGWAKPSTGYTFMSTAKKIPVLLDYIKTGQPLNDLSFKNKFWFYDLLYLDVLAANNEIGHQIFQSLFQHREPQLIFKFLDEDTSLLEDISCILACPKKLFIKALLKRLL